MSLRLFKVTAVELLSDGKLDHPHDGEYHRDEDDVDDDDHGLGNGEDGEGHHEDDGGGIRRQEGGEEELQNVSNCIAHSLHRLPDRYILIQVPFFI